MVTPSGIRSIDARPSNVQIYATKVGAEIVCTPKTYFVMRAHD